jgi:hypothetical protein
VSERYGSEQLDQHRAILAFELDVVSQKVQRFGWHDMASQMKDRLTKDWVDCLEPYPFPEVKRGIADCLEVDPKKCPTEQAVRLAIHKRRAKAIRESESIEPEQEKERPATKEEAKKVLDEAGVKVVNGRIVL